VNDTRAIQPGLFDSTDRALSLDPEGHSADELFRLGVTAAGGGNVREAEHWYQAAARGGHTRAMESLAAIALSHDDPALAERWYGQAVELGDFELAYGFALVLHDQGKSEQAVRALWRAAAAQDPRAMVLLGEMARRSGEPEQAEYWCQAGAALHHGPALYDLSLVRAERADYAGAEEAMTEAAGAGETRAMGTAGALAESRRQTKEALGWYERGAARGDQECIDGLRRLGGSGMDMSGRESQIPSTGSSEPDLFAALGTGSRLAVARALDGGASVEARGQKGLTVLFLAASWGRTEILSLLIDAGADLEACDECGNTPLMAAVIDGEEHAKVVALLLRAGADPMRPNLAGATPALLAATLPAEVRQLFPTDPNPLGLPSLETVGGTPNAAHLLVGGVPMSIGGEQVIQHGMRVRMLYEGDLNQTVGGQPLSAAAKAHIRCYLVAGGSPVEP
jgi:TPR repeat protein